MLKFLCFTLLISTASCDVDDFVLPKYSTAMSRAVIDYIVNYFYDKSSTVTMYHISQPENINKNLDMMNEILYHVKTKIVIQVDSLMDVKLSTRKRISNIIFVDSFESFKIIHEKMDYNHFEFQGYYLIVVTSHVYDIYLKMMRIFEALWTNKIINANILFMPQENTNDAILFTYFPYSNYYCENVVPIQLNHFRGDSWMRKINYFPRKLSNFFGCHLRVATFNNPPFMIIKEDENGVITVDGVEGILLRVLSQRFNFNVDLYLPQTLWGSIYKNGTSTGAVKMIVDSEVNFTLGFFASIPIRDAVMQPTSVYYTTNLVWMVPPGKPQIALEKLTNPLHKVVWIMSSATFIIGFVVIVVVKMQPLIIQQFVFGNKTQSPAMNFISVVLGNSLHQVPMRNFSRFLLVSAMIYFFIIRTCYISGLVKFMQMDTRGQHLMNTAEMVRDNFTFYIMGASRDYVLEMPEILEREKTLLVHEFNSKLLDMIVDPYYDGAFLTSIDHLAYRNFKVYPKMFHEFAPTPVFTLNIVIYMNLGSCLRLYFDEMLMMLVSSGLINKWASGFIDSRYLKKPVDDELKILSLDQLEGAFQLLVGGLFIGFVAFCFENLIGRNLFNKFKSVVAKELSNC
ncbi:unnamed protein product [Chironomus riparius]|uniref:Ionotropic glutamate receptor L-glutamate and glycine-binding domain-containing protein n=1 Tax=Chironomus riparius TaxID=315576 RepID=A0A9N9RJA3_9DIPT|nr:unnamed protein product [Chironomus riparius]